MQFCLSWHAPASSNGTILENRTNTKQSVMKKALIIFTLITSGLYAQERPQNHVTVNGQGAVSVIPDQAQLVFSIENKGSNAADVKKQNDATVAKVLQAIGKAKIAEKDVMTQRVALHPQYDYEKKKYTYFASQTISILLRDLTRYDKLMEALIDAGVNQISSVEFKYSKIEEAKTEARKKAMLDARRKADDLTSAIGQKAGIAIAITEIDQPAYFPRHYEMAMAKSADEAQPTLAVGELDVKANVTVSFLLQ